MGPSVTRTILQMLNSGLISHELNHTFIALILKKKQTVRLGDFALIIQLLVVLAPQTPSNATKTV